MQNTIPNLRQSSIISEKPGYYLSGKLKTFANSNYRIVNTFVPNAPFLYPLKTLENCKVTLGKGTLGANGLNILDAFFSSQCPEKDVRDFFVLFS